MFLILKISLAFIEKFLKEELNGYFLKPPWSVAKTSGDGNSIEIKASCWDMF